ncbi:MAG: phage tail sheath subtilisin-like domain-containing protein [Nannocystaceae bacterium]
MYLEEVASGARTITGVATSITAFVGRAARGPVDAPVDVLSYGDFERIFGGLDPGSALGYAVRGYFQNGGGQAVVVRVHRGAKAATIKVGALKLRAADPGSWGDALRASVDVDVADESAARLGVPRERLFNLTIRDTGPSGRVEVHRNVTLVDSARSLGRVLAGESTLARYSDDLDPASYTPTAKLDDVSAREAELATARAGGDAGMIGAAQAALTTALAALGGADGDPISDAELLPEGGEASKRGLHALLGSDAWSLLVIPPFSGPAAPVRVDPKPATIGAVAAFCEARRAFYLIDAPASWSSVAAAKAGVDALGTASRNAAVFFPSLVQGDPLREGQLVEVAPTGAVAGVFARTDAQRGVWKAPAGQDATLVGVARLTVPLTDAENGALNPLGINCLRTMPAAGPLVWGARTRQGSDRLASEWKYVPVRRLTLFIEESLYRGTQWVIFEPNDEPLWGQIRLGVGAFLQGLFRQGAFQGRSPREAYFVKCDRETTTPDDVNRGVVNLHVGFAPLRPAEFVVLRIQQLAESNAT